MNANITQCPKCSTRFRVNAAQLEAHQGMVRCGRCHNAFNAGEHLHDNTPNPQLNLPIGEPTLTELAQTQESAPAPTPATLAQQVEFIEELTDEVPLSSRRTRRWPWLLGCAFMALLLSAQIAYFYPVEIVTQLPAAKPWLQQYCEQLKCTVSLPKNAELLRIDSSDLEADPQQANVITLHALLHNNAPYSQAYPELELTLLDLEEKVIARRVFHPADYLKSAEDEAAGIAPNRDASVKLHLDTSELKPSGYKLFLLYTH